MNREGIGEDFSWQQGSWVLGCSVGDAAASLTDCCSHQAGQQSPQLCAHTAQTLLVPSQGSLWSCSGGSAGSLWAGDCWRQRAQLGAELSEMLSGLLGPLQRLPWEHRGGTWMVGGPLRAGRTEESELSLAELALECHCPQLLWCRVLLLRGSGMLLGLPWGCWLLRSVARWE